MIFWGGGGGVAAMWLFLPGVKVVLARIVWAVVGAVLYVECIKCTIII